MDEMALARGREVFDGLDITAEFERICSIPMFAEALTPRPTLLITRWKQRKNTYGTARGGYRIKLNLFEGIDRFDVMEVLVHELTHIYCQRVFDRVRDGSIYNPVPTGHSNRFWVTLNRAIEQSYGELRVAPRTNRYHGRYADALRRRTITEQVATFEAEVAQLLQEEPVAALVATPERKPLTLPEPLRTWQEDMPEPQHNRFGGPARVVDVRGTPAPLEDRRITRGEAAVNARDASIVALLEEHGRMHIDTMAMMLHITNGQIRHATARMRRAGTIVKVGTGTWALARPS
jgi:hypothetical protein